MSSDEFDILARLYVVGALEPEEIEEFQQARKSLGEEAEETIREYRKLNEAFALSLRPSPPHPDTKRKLLERIRRSMAESPEPVGEGNGHTAAF